MIKLCFLFYRKDRRYCSSVALHSGACLPFETFKVVGLYLSQRIFQIFIAFLGLIMTDAQTASAFEEFSISSTNINDVGELKVSHD